MKTKAKKIIAAFLTVFMMTTVSFSQTITTTLGDINACPGDNVVVPMDVTNFNNVSSISLVVYFDSTQINFITEQNLAPGLAGPLFLLNSLPLNNNPDYNKQVRISWFGFAPLNVGAGVLMEFVFYYEGDTAELVWSNVAGETQYSDPTLQNIPATFIDGGLSPADAIINTQPIDQNVDEGLNTSFSVDATLATGYQWQESNDGGTNWLDLSDGGVYSGTTTNVLTLTTVPIGLDGYKYQCVVADACSGVTTDIATLTVNPVANPLAVTAEADPILICEGEMTQLDAIASGGSGSYTYTWISDPTGFTSNIQNPTDSPLVTTTYTVSVDDGAGTATDHVVVTVNPLPVVFNVTGGGSYCAGGNGISIGLDNSENGVNYDLFFNGSFSGQSITGTGAAIDFGSQTDEGSYTIVATNSCGSRNMNGQAVIEINPYPIAFNVTGGGSYCLGGNGFEIGLDGSEPGVTYELFLNETSTGITFIGDGMAFNFGLQTAEGNYTVAGTNNCGTTAMMGIVMITILPLPAADAGQDVAICLGECTDLTASGGVTYMWNDGNTDAMISVCPTTTTTYIVTVTDNNGCSDTDDVMITVNSNPVADAGADVSVCEGTCTTLTASGGMMYLWNNSSTNASIVVCPTSTMTYGVTVTDGNGCTDSDDVTVTVNTNPVADAGADVSICAGECTTLTASGGMMYLWSNSATTASINVCPANTMTYNVTITDGNACTDSDEVTVTVNNNPVADAGADVTICETDCATLTATGGVSYLWSEGSTDASINICPTTNTTYNVTVTDINGCTASDDVTVTVNPLPSVFNVVLPPSGGGYCAGGTGVDICVDGWENGVNYELYFNGAATGLITGGQAGGFCFGSQTGIGTYTVYATSVNNGCSVMMNGSADVFEYPLPDQYNVTGGGSYCAGGNGVSVGLSSSQTDVTYILFVDGNVVLPLVAGTGSALDFGLQTAAGNYTIVAENNTSLCQNNMIGSVDIVINPLPVADAGQDVSICTGDCHNLTASGGSTYFWSNSETTNIINVCPLSTETYSVTVTDINGCTDSDEVTITIDPLPAVFNISGGGNICAGNSVEVGIDGSEIGVDYELFIDGMAAGNLFPGTGSALSFGNQTMPGTYTAKGYNSCGNTDMNGSVNITIDPLPGVFNVTGGGSYCDGGAGVEIGIDGSEAGADYELFLNGTSTGNIIPGNNMAINFGNIIPAGTYTVVATNNCGSTNMSGQADVTITVLTAFTSDPINTTVIEGATAYFNVAASNANTYQWQLSTDGGSIWNDLFNSTIYSGVNTTTLEVQNVFLNMDSYLYRCTATGVCNTAVSNVAMLGVSPPMGTITTTAVSQIVPQGSNTVVVPIFATNFVDVAAIALKLSYNTAVLTYDSIEYVHPGLSKQYLVDFASGGEVNISWIDVAAANIGNDTIFKLRFTYNGGSSYLVWNTMTVANCQYANSIGAIFPSIFINGSVNQFGATPISSQPVDINICEGNTGYFMTVAPSATTYQWQESTNGGLSWTTLTDGGMYSGVNTASLSISNLTTAMSGAKYQCILDLGMTSEAISTAALLTVTPWTTENIIVNSDAGTTICNGTNVTFSANVQYPVTSPQYTWMVNGNVVGTNATYSSTSINDGDIVSCGILSPNDCFAGVPGQITMTVIDIPVKAAMPAGPVSLCENSSDTDYTTSGATYASTYVWEITPAAAGIITGTGLTATVDWNTAFTGVATIKVKAQTVVVTAFSQMVWM
jgi:predicted transcriptional regulator